MRTDWNHVCLPLTAHLNELRSHCLQPCSCNYIPLQPSAASWQTWSLPAVSLAAYSNTKFAWRIKNEASQIHVLLTRRGIGENILFKSKSLLVHRLSIIVFKWDLSQWINMIHKMKQFVWGWWVIPNFKVGYIQIVRFADNYFIRNIGYLQSIFQIDRCNNASEQFRCVAIWEYYECDL